MNRILLIFSLALLFVPVRETAAQPQDTPQVRPRDGMPRRERIDRVERLKQMRMIEELNLGEDEAVRFMAKRKEHEDRMKALAGERNALLDVLAAAVDGEADATTDRRTGRKAPEVSVERAVGDVLDQDRKMFDERRRYQEEMRKMLPMEKFAKMLVFEREFQMQVRDAMGKNLKRPRKYDE